MEGKRGGNTNKIKDHEQKQRTKQEHSIIYCECDAAH